MDAITEIKQKLDIVDVIGSYISLNKSGRNYKGLCPFHTDHNPSFMVSKELQIYKCFVCNEGGDVFKFIQRIEGIEFPEALKQLAEKAGVTLEQSAFEKENADKKILYEINHLAASLYHFLLTKHPAGKSALEYLKKKRKLKDETIHNFNLGFAPRNWDTLLRSFTKKGYRIEDLVKAGVLISRSTGVGYVDKFRGRIMFPFTDINGKTVGFSGRVLDDSKPKYLNSPETPIFHKGSFIYGLDKAKISIKKEGVIVVEGHMDCITAHQFGFTNVIASGGTALTADQLKILGRYTKDLILCFDADLAGDAAIQRGIELAEKENFNIRVIVIPAPYKDIDEMLQADLNSGTQIIKNPIPVYDFYLISALKHNDKNTALGKKKIIEELTEKFFKVTNKVVIDHYVKKISEDLDISEDTLRSIFEKKNTVNVEELVVNTGENYQNEGNTFYNLSKKSPQEYMIALLLKAPLDTAQTFLYKLGQKDFTNPQIQGIFTELKEYTLGRKHKFKIEYFNRQISEEQQKIINDLYLWDLGNLSENETKFNAEIEAIYDRVKKEAAKREIREMSERIKQAELEKDTKALKELTEKLKVISSRLV